MSSIYQRETLSKRTLKCYFIIAYRLVIHNEGIFNCADKVIVKSQGWQLNKFNLDVRHLHLESLRQDLRDFLEDLI